MKSYREFSAIYLHRDPIDMRKGLNGLLAHVQSAQMGVIKANSVFVFCGRRKNSIKAVYFDHSGFCLWMKRLELDRFKWPKADSQGVVHLSADQFGYLLSGFDLSAMKPFKKVDFERIF